MSAQIAKTMLRLAISLSDEAYTGQSYLVHEWESDLEYRILLVIDSGYETDIVFNRVTRTWRCWKNGIEWGAPSDN